MFESPVIKWGVSPRFNTLATVDAISLSMTLLIPVGD